MKNHILMDVRSKRKLKFMSSHSVFSLQIFCLLLARHWSLKSLDDTLAMVSRKLMFQHHAMFVVILLFLTLRRKWDFVTLFPSIIWTTMNGRDLFSVLRDFHDFLRKTEFNCSANKSVKGQTLGFVRTRIFYFLSLSSPCYNANQKCSTHCHPP